jgi:CRISPR/Cas system CSM-associated protein Csm3 (group 7 of RAMP superfamily)
LELSERVVKSFPRDEEIKPYSDADFTLPYKLTLENNIHDNLFRVRWNHKGVDFELKININEIPSELRSKYFREGTRGVKDTEWHYFGGTSSNSIRQLKFRKHEFLANQKAWYGPMYDLIEGMECEKIMCDLFNMEPENV